MSEIITTSIRDQLFYKTGMKFSNKYIQKNIIPIIKFIIYKKKNKFLLSGSQGIGKSTLVHILVYVIEKFYHKKVMAISLDNYYLSKKQRVRLSESIHPLLITRGVPGTHDIQRLKADIEKFKHSKFPIYTPIFDKLTDNKTQRIKRYSRADILILEGWCCGAKPIIKNYLHKDINMLEKNKDKNKIWRNHYNNKLKNEYAQLFDMFDKTIFLKATSFNQVLKWRHKQEKMNKLESINQKKMNKKNLIQFIQYYEKITKWMLKVLPSKTGLLVKIDKNQKITSIN